MASSLRQVVLSRIQHIINDLEVFLPSSPIELESSTSDYARFDLSAGFQLPRTFKSEMACKFSAKSPASVFPIAKKFQQKRLHPNLDYVRKSHNGHSG